MYTFWWNFNQNTTIFHYQNAFENVVWKMVVILSRPQCVKSFHVDDKGLFRTAFQSNTAVNTKSADGIATERVKASTIMMLTHYSDVIMTTTASQITSLTVVYSTVYSDADQRKHQSSDGVMRSSILFFAVSLNKMLNKQGKNWKKYFCCWCCPRIQNNNPAWGDSSWLW